MQTFASTTDDNEALSTGWTHRDRHEVCTANPKAPDFQPPHPPRSGCVVDRILAYDHDRMGWLASAATIIGIGGELEVIATIGSWCWALRRRTEAAC